MGQSDQVRAYHGAVSGLGSLRRRELLRLAAGSVALPLLHGEAAAQSYPARPVRIAVGFRAGSATDVDARLIAQALAERLKQNVIVDDRPGAGGNIAAEGVAHAAPDGSTLLMLTVSNAVNVTLYRKLNFDIVGDIAPVGTTMRTASLLVINPSIPVKTIPELIIYAKAHRGKLNYASGGYGSAPNMAAELFKMMADVDLVHVPYSTNPVPDLVRGQVQVFFSPLPATIGYAKAGKLRALAVTSAARSPALPDVPAVAEFIPGYVADVWHGIGAPKNTPTKMIDTLNNAINAVLADPALKQRYANLGAQPMPMTPAAFGKFLADEIAKWAKVIQFAHIKPV
jgi:tripartite-type tricarboxylate transporter receptor subunit TctC